MASPRIASLNALKASTHFLINEAIGWHSASRRCFAEIPITPNTYQSLTNQAIVANAFSIELYTKLILILCNINPSRGHNYHIAFMKLPQNIRLKVESYFHIGWPYFDISFEKYLEDTGAWFVDFRYIYDIIAIRIDDGVTQGSILPGIDFNKYWQVTRAMHNTAIELSPSLASQMERGA